MAGSNPLHADHGYSASLTAKVVGITYRQLDYWARTDLVRPSKTRASGSGSRREYSYDNLLELKVIKRLLDAGIKLEKVRSIFDYMRHELQEDISTANLVIDGSNVVCVRSDAEWIDVLQKGQGVLNVLALSNLKHEVDAAIIELHRPAADQHADALRHDKAEGGVEAATGEADDDVQAATGGI